MKKLFFITSLTAMTLGAKVFAQDEFEQVQVLDHPRYTLTEKITIDAGITYLPLDAYYKPILAEVAASYQPADFFSIEAVRFGYALHNYDTGQTAAIEQAIKVKTGKSYTLKSDQELKDMRFKVSSMAFLNLLYSKSNWFNRSVAYHYWQVGIGPSYYDMDGVSQVGVDLAMQVRFFLTDNLVFNLRGGHTLGFKKEAPKNITNLGVGLGVSF